jgi:hypothetical protein
MAILGVGLRVVGFLGFFSNLSFASCSDGVDFRSTRFANDLDIT